MLTNCERVIEEIVQDDILLVPVNSYEQPAKSLRINGEHLIFFNERAYETEGERYLALSHEKEHCDYDVFYTECTPLALCAWNERKIRQRVIQRCLPPRRIKKAIQACMSDGCAELCDLSEWLSLPEYFVKDAIDYYTAIGAI